MNRNHPCQTHHFQLVMGLTLLLAGCETDERVVKVANEAAERQAKQNLEQSKLNREIAAATKQLVEEEANARRQSTQLQRDIQQERNRLSESWGELEERRQEVSDTLRRESLLAQLFRGSSVTLVALISLLFAWIVLSQTDSQVDLELTSVELLLGESTLPEISSSERLLEKEQMKNQGAESTGQPPQLEQDTASNGDHTHPAERTPP